MMSGCRVFAPTDEKTYLFTLENIASARQQAAELSTPEGTCTMCCLCVIQSSYSWVLLARAY